MVKDKRFLVAVVATVLVVGWFLFSGGGPEAAINKRLDALIELVEKDGQEGQIAALSTAKKISTYFTDNCVVSSSQARITMESSEDMIAAMASARGYAQTIDLSIRSRSITMNAGNESATMNLVIHVNADIQGTKDSGSGEYYLEWAKTPDGWKIQRVVPVKE